jgi:ribonuclease G
MNKEMIISSSGHDTRVAILEDDQVVEIFIERENQRGVVGNLYKGRVSKVLPGMQSSFVDIGLERDAFLYVSEVVNTVEEFEKLAGGDDEDEPDARAHDSREAVAESQGTEGRVEAALDAEGAIAGSASTVAAVVPERRARDRDRDHSTSSWPSRAASKDDRSGASGEARAERREPGGAQGPAPKIEDLLKEGQEVLVQVVKEPLGTKGARLTSHVTMPGRFLVFMPTVDHVVVSRKIESRY